MQRPDTDEVAPYFRRYTDLVPDGDLFERLAGQMEETVALFGRLSDAQADSRYRADAWSVKEVVGHLADTERVFCYRALRFGRGDATPLSGFDQDAFVAGAGFAGHTLAEITAEFQAVRSATIALFKGFDVAASRRAGVANGNRISVRGIAFCIAGHELHHLTVLHERYGIG
jgi:DinB superfamily